MGLHDDKRKFPRAHIVLPVSVARGKDTQQVEIEDVTVEGISLLSKNDLPKGASISVIIPSGKELAENTVPGEVLRCQPLKGDADKRFRVIVKFLEINDALLMDILALIHREDKKIKK